jgi:NAD+ diphosphatase
MLQTPLEFSPILAPPSEGFSRTYNFIFKGDELLIRESDFALPENSVLQWLGLEVNDARFHSLGLLGDVYCRTAFVKPNIELPSGYRFSKMRPLWSSMSMSLLSVAGRAFQISDWARTHQFCGACAAPMHLVVGERCYRCSTCRFMAYPRISPAMMVLVRKGNSILLARHTAAVGNRFSALAGFVEAGESVEETVHREVFEEVGLKVNNLKYFSSQSWPYPHSLMIAFTAEYVSGEITVDTTEIAEAKWFGPGDPLPEFLRGVSISGELISANLPK